MHIILEQEKKFVRMDLSIVAIIIVGPAVLVLLDICFSQYIRSRFPGFSDEEEEYDDYHDRQRRDFDRSDFPVETTGAEIEEIPERYVVVWLVPFSELEEYICGGEERVESCNDCAVCLEEFEGEDMCAVLPLCRHVYHPYCLQQWFRQQGTCPVCRIDVGDEESIV